MLGLIFFFTGLHTLGVAPPPLPGSKSPRKDVRKPRGGWDGATAKGRPS